jgi:tetratricopeptide (TPR) repeat protein
MRLHRSTLLTLAVSLALVAGCQSDEDKVETFLENAQGYVDEGSFNEAVIEYRNVLQIDPNHAGAHYALAKAYLELKRGKEAFWELSETVRLDPKNTEARMTLGGLSLIAQNFDEALEQAERTLEIDPSESSAWVLKAQALERLGRPAEAEAAYQKAMEQDPEQGTYRLVAAGYYVRQGRRDEAEPLLREYARMSPGFLSHSSLGRFLAEDRGRSDEAIASFRAALETATDEERPNAVQNLANYYFVLGRIDDAVALAEEGIAQAPAESDAKLDLIYLLARFKRAQGKGDEADRLIESATAAQPNAVKPQLILSAYRSRQGDLDGALESAEAALAIDPDDLRARLRKAELLIDIGYRRSESARIEEGRAIVEEILARQPSNADALFVKGKVELARNEPQEAVKSLRAALDSRPDWAQAHFVLGSALTLVGDESAARVEVARAVELDPDLLEARRMLAKLHAALGEHEYVVEQGNAYLKERPDDIKTRILVAQSLARLGKAAAAQAELDKIPETEWNAEVLFARARLALGMNDVKTGRALLVRAAAKEPHHPEILGSLLALDRGTPQIQETRALIEAAAVAKPDDSEIARLNGALAIVLGDAPTAEKSLQRAIELDPRNMSAYQQLAALYQATGRLGQTLSTYEKALEQRPDSAQLHHFVAVLYGRSTSAPSSSTRTWGKPRTTSATCSRSRARISTAPSISPRTPRP